MEREIEVFCKEVAEQMTLKDLESKADPKRLVLLRKQALELVKASEKSLQESRARPLLQAALGALEAATLKDSVGERRYGAAAKALAVRHQQGLKRSGPLDPELLPELEALGLLFRLGGMRDARWRDEALRIRIARADRQGVPDRLLEGALVEAIEDHYGPWLTVAEVEPMLEFCGHLARAWSRYPQTKELTRQVLDLGLKSEAERVWNLAAREAPEGLREELRALVDRLDPSSLEDEKHLGSLVGLGQALLDTPLDAAARRLLKRVDRGGTTPISNLLRRRIARLLGDADSEAALLATELQTSPPAAAIPLLEPATELLKQHPHPDLLELGTRKLLAAARLEPVPDEVPRLLEEWMEFQTRAGHPEAAQECLESRLSLADPSGRDIQLRCRFLARLQRWEDLDLFLAPLPEDRVSLLWRFRAALGRERILEAFAFLDRWLDQVLRDIQGEVPTEAPGLSRALPHFSQKPERLSQLAARCGPTLLPSQEALLRKEPWRILVALDPEAPQQLPDPPEQALRWRLNQLPRERQDRIKALQQIAEESEHRLGPTHPLLPEVLLVLGKEQKEGREAITSLERAVALLEAESPTRTQLLVDASSCLAQVQGAAGKGRQMEKELRRLLGLLERIPASGEEIEKEAREIPALLLLHLWREQRLQELLALAPRILALHPKPPAKEGEFTFEMGPRPSNPAQSLAALERIVRLQDQLRAAGL